jgi:hypothetical protein
VLVPSRAWLAIVATLQLAACSASSAPESPPPEQKLQCDKGLEAFRGACVDPATRYEPAAPIDSDNVVAYGAVTKTLSLPAPPKSGFRLVMPVRTLKPGEEQYFCAAWAFPKIKNTLVYAARLYTTSGLHHSNVISNPPNPDKGPNPYPKCWGGASNPFGMIGSSIPDVLFANSTQVVGTETLAFPPGMAYRVNPAREIIADVHLLNTAPQAQAIEVVYDFFTMPDSELVSELGPFVADNRAFNVPAMQTATTTTECRTFGGTIATIMPHTHNFATSFQVQAIDWDDKPAEIYRKDGYDLASDIRIYDPGFSIEDTKSVRFSCTFANTKTTPLVYGNANQEMCILFGYLYPAKKAFAGYQYEPDAKCASVQVGALK